MKGKKVFVTNSVIHSCISSKLYFTTEMKTSVICAPMPLIEMYRIIFERRKRKWQIFAQIHSSTCDSSSKKVCLFLSTITEFRKDESGMSRWIWMPVNRQREPRLLLVMLRGLFCRRWTDSSVFVFAWGGVLQSLWSLTLFLSVRVGGREALCDPRLPDFINKKGSWAW